MNAHMGRIAGPAILSLLVILFNWKLVLTDQYTWLESVDITTQVLPWFQFQASEWHHWRIPLWDPTSWYGQPIFGEALPAAAYPLNWLLFWSSLKNGWLRQSHLHWYYVLVRVLAALSAYALCRELGRSRRASILGGLIYGIGGYVGNTDWPQTVNGAITAPLVFLYLLRADRLGRMRDALLSGFFMGFGWLAGHHQMNLLVSIAAGALWIWIAVRDGLRPRAVHMTLAATLMAALASGLQTIPTAEYGQRAVRWVGAAEPVNFTEKVPYFVHQGFSLDPIALLSPFLPGLQVTSNPFVGLIAMTLAIAGAILGWKERWVPWLTTIGIASMIYALGANSIFHGWMYALLPLIEKARTPVASDVVFGLTLAPLAAYGLDTLVQSPLWCSRLARGLLAINMFLLSISLYSYLFHIDLDHRLMLSGFVAGGIAIVLAMWNAGTLSASAGTVILIMGALLEVGMVTNYQLPNRYVKEQSPRLHLLAENSDLAAYLRERADAGRVEYDDNLIPYNFGAWYGIDTYVAPGASAPEDLWKLGVFSPRSKDFFDVHFYIGKEPNRPEQYLAFKGAHDLNIYENPNAFPRAFAVHNVIVQPDIVQLRARFSDPAVNLRKTALLAKPLPLETCDGEDDVEFVHRTANTVRVEAKLACKGLVVVTENWFPGWRATVDGRPAEIVKVNGAVRGIVVEPGSHVIEMNYRPLSVMIGAAMTLLAAVIASAAWFKR
jgi:hypothetical protein